MKKLYSIEGVKCGGCAAVVKEKLSDIEGVESVDVDVAEKKINSSRNSRKRSIAKSLERYKI